MNVVFMGTPEFAVSTLSELLGQGHSIVGVYTRPPAESGRGMKSRPSPVHTLAERLGIPVYHPRSLRSDDAVVDLSRLAADVGVVVAYGMILPEALLAVPRLGCLNLHASLLPRWRGAAPIQRAILAGDEETGVCIMRMEAGLDTGPVLLEGRMSIDARTAGELTRELSMMGATLMTDALADLPHRSPVPQPGEGVTYAAKIDKAETRIDWSMSARRIERQVRAFAPMPGAWFELNGERIKILATSLHPGSIAEPPGTVLNDELVVSCGKEAIRPTLLQRPGGKPLPAVDVLRGFPIAPGTRLA